MSPVAFRLYWEDNNARGARTSWWLPGDLSIPEWVARANAIRAGARRVSNARIVRGAIEIDSAIEPDPGPAGESDIRQNLVLLFRDERGSYSLRIPSPADLPYDISGPYAGIRLGREEFLASGLLEPLETVLNGLLYPWQDDAPYTFVVGSLEHIP